MARVDHVYTICIDRKVRTRNDEPGGHLPGENPYFPPPPPPLSLGYACEGNINERHMLTNIRVTASIRKNMTDPYTQQVLEYHEAFKRRKFMEWKQTKEEKCRQCQIRLQGLSNMTSHGLMAHYGARTCEVCGTQKRVLFLDTRGPCMTPSHCADCQGASESMIHILQKDQNRLNEFVECLGSESFCPHEIPPKLI